MTFDPFARYARLDPVRDDRPDWDALGPVLLEAIDARTGPMVIETTHAAEHERHRRRPAGHVRWLAVAAALAIVITAVVAIALAIGDRDRVPADDFEAPAPITVPAQQRASATAIASQFAATVERGDLNEVLATLSPESDCDLPVGSTETCEQHWGYLLAIGTSVDVERCDDGEPAHCELGLRSELHALMGYPQYSLPASIWVDADGRVISDFGDVPLDKAYLGTVEAGTRLWSAVAAARPDLTISLNSGPDLYDREAGEAAMQVASELNDPTTIVEALQSELDERWMPRVMPNSCVTQDGATDCRDLFEFLYAIDADIDLICDDAVDWIIPCVMTMTSDIHEALGSSPANTPAELAYRAGVVTGVTIDVRFASDPALHDAFIQHAMTIDGLYRDTASEADIRPIRTEDSATAWLAAAEEYART